MNVTAVVSRYEQSQHFTFSVRCLSILRTVRFWIDKHFYGLRCQLGVRGAVSNEDASPRRLTGDGISASVGDAERRFAFLAA